MDNDNIEEVELETVDETVEETKEEQKEEVIEHKEERPLCSITSSLCYCNIKL